MFFIPLLKATNITPKFQTRNIFNTRHFSRYESGQELSIIINKIKYKVLNISSEGLAFIAADFSIKNKKIIIKIIDKDDFEILAKAKIVYRYLWEENKYRIGLKIIKMDNEFLMHWDNLVNKYKNLKIK